MMEPKFIILDFLCEECFNHLTLEMEEFSDYVSVIIRCDVCEVAEEHELELVGGEEILI